MKFFTKIFNWFDTKQLKNDLEIHQNILKIQQARLVSLKETKVDKRTRQGKALKYEIKDVELLISQLTDKVKTIENELNAIKNN